MIDRFKIEIIFALLILLAVGCSKYTSEKHGADKTVLKKPSDFFTFSKPQVLVVGSFHFDYPGLDGHKTKKEDKLDVLSQARQLEMTVLIEYLKKFNPNKIAIEARNGWGATTKLRAYKKGQYRDRRNEIYQIAFRMASELKFDTIYELDANSFNDDLMAKDSAFVAELWEDYDWKGHSKTDSLQSVWQRYRDSVSLHISLLEIFKYMNSPESHRYGYGSYFLGDFKLGKYRGADVLSIYWYNRNLRIFRNLQRMTDGPGDRILILFGNGHAALLRQFLEFSPEYDFIEFNDLEQL